MLLFILRHGDPIYCPDSLTPQGHLQAKALAKRLALYGIDEIYTSPLVRARQTAEETCILTGKTANIRDWMSESSAWDDFATRTEPHSWIFMCGRDLELRERSVTDLGLNWFTHPLFSDINGKGGYERILDESDKFFESLGYVHDREKCAYRVENPNEKHVAVFCHEGFGLAWLGTLLDIPLPYIWSRFTISHTGMTVIEFRTNGDGYCMPKVLTFSNDSHLYREGLPTKYQNRIFF